MKWASALSEQTPLANAIEECVVNVCQQLGESAPELAVVFVSSHHGEQFEELPGMVGEKLGHPLVLGCSGGGIIGNGVEVEQQPAVSITAANLPDVTLAEFHLEAANLPDLDAAPQAWEELVKASRGNDPQFIL